MAVGSRRETNSNVKSSRNLDSFYPSFAKEVRHTNRHESFAKAKEARNRKSRRKLQREYFTLYVIFIVFPFALAVFMYINRGFIYQFISKIL